MNKHLLYKVISLVLLLAPSAIYAIEPGESSENIVTIWSACTQSNGYHLWKFNIQNYDLHGLYGGNYYTYNDTISFTSFDYTKWGSAIVYTYDCLSEDLESWTLRNATSDTQISPEVVNVTTKFILLDDWERSNGSDYHTNTILDRITGKIYYINADTLRNSNKSLNDFVGDGQLFWTIKSYQRNVLTVSVRKSSWNYIKTKTFFVKLK